jgi:hypothetical protein
MGQPGRHARIAGLTCNFAIFQTAREGRLSELVLRTLVSLYNCEYFFQCLCVAQRCARASPLRPSSMEARDGLFEHHANHGDMHRFCSTSPLTSTASSSQNPYPWSKTKQMLCCVSERFLWCESGNWIRKIAPPPVWFSANI